MNDKKPKRWGLMLGGTRYYARELVDADYLDKLSEAELDWLDRFSREYNNNDFVSHDPLTPREQRKKYHARNNERRRDMWTNMTRMPHDYTDFISKKDNGDEDDE